MAIRVAVDRFMASFLLSPATVTQDHRYRNRRQHTSVIVDFVSDREEVRRRIIDAAAELLRTEGREAVTTRAVSAAAGVQSPVLYRLFTDMNGLLDAVASDGFARYLAGKRAQALSGDPVDDLRRGWDLHVEFGLQNPAHYLLMYGRPSRGCGGCACSSSASRPRDASSSVSRRP
jgi:AcrR family transcriptional regulator